MKKRQRYYAAVDAELRRDFRVAGAALDLGLVLGFGFAVAATAAAAAADAAAAASAIVVPLEVYVGVGVEASEVVDVEDPCASPCFDCAKNKIKSRFEERFVKLYGLPLGTITLPPVEMANSVLFTHACAAPDTT